MKRYSHGNRYTLFFSGWSKKGYAIFAGLGREVRIARLSVHMYKNILLKAIGNGIIINTDKSAGHDSINVAPVLTIRQVTIVALAMGEVCPDGLNNERI